MILSFLNFFLNIFQVTGEEFFFNDAQFTEMFSLAKIGVKEIISKQKEALK